MKPQSDPMVSLFIVFNLALALTACSLGQAPLTPVTLQLDWTHEAQFAGFYAADQEGYYAAEGLAVKFVAGGPKINVIASVLAGPAQFGLMAGDGLMVGISKGNAVQAVAVDYRRSPRVFITLASSGITRPQDFAGKTISTGAGAIPMVQTMMEKVGVQPGAYTTVLSTPDLSDLYSGKAQVRVGFLTSEVLAARAAGYQVNIIYPDDYGFHFYGDTLFTTQAMIASQPGVVLRFVRASLKGWAYAVEHPAEMGATVLKYDPSQDVTLQNAMMAASLPLVNTGADFIGWMKAETWQGMEQTLLQQGGLSKPLDTHQVYTMQFLQQIYP